MRPLAVIGCGVVVLGAMALGMVAWVASASGDRSREHLRGLEGELQGAEVRRETGLAIENARVAGVERGLDEARSLADTDPDQRDAILEARRTILETEARSAAAQIAEEDARARREANTRLLEADREDLSEDMEALSRRVILCMFGLAVAVLIPTVWLLGRRERALASKLAATGETMATGAVELARTRADLERSVDEKTAALAVALDESRDLNARLKEAQERLVRQEKMAALGTLAGGIAHEFNNLLGGIRGCAEDLRTDASDAGVQETLDVIVRAARRGRTIVDGLQTFSQAGGKERQRVDLADVVAEVLRLVAPAAQERGVALRGAGDDSDVSVVGDPIELHQVVQNLVQNAVQASGEGSMVEVDLTRREDRVLVSVKDRGHGVPPGDASRVFEPFFTTRELDGGTGLGLAITHGIVQALGGSLTFRDRPDGGTVFVADLPYAERG